MGVGKANVPDLDVIELDRVNLKVTVVEGAN